jgi:hypothetical protein
MRKIYYIYVFLSIVRFQCIISYQNNCCNDVECPTELTEDDCCDYGGVLVKKSPNNCNCCNSCLVTRSEGQSCLESRIVGVNIVCDNSAYCDKRQFICKTKDLDNKDNEDQSDFEDEWMNTDENSDDNPQIESDSSNKLVKVVSSDVKNLLANFVSTPFRRRSVFREDNLQ